VTKRQTNRQRCSICSNRPHPASAAMQPNNIICMGHWVSQICYQLCDKTLISQRTYRRCHQSQTVQILHQQTQLLLHFASNNTNLRDRIQQQQQQQQQPVEQPFIQVDLSQPVPEETFTHSQPVFVAIIQHL